MGNDVQRIVSYGCLVVICLVVSGSLSAVAAPTGHDHVGSPTHLSPDSSNVDRQTAPTASATETETTATRQPSQTTRQPDEVRRRLGPVTVTIFLNCTLFRVDVTPDGYRYDLHLTYEDTATGRIVRMAAGPLSGAVEDPFGETRYQLLEVEVRVEGSIETTRFAPERCLDR